MKPFCMSTMICAVRFGPHVAMALCNAINDRLKVDRARHGEIPF
jgi:hypothetical protein